MTPDLWTAVDQYIAGQLAPADAALTAALESSTAAGLPAINVSPTQGKLLHILARLAEARSILEIGTLGGYSTIWLARALLAGGRLITLEADARHAELAAANIARAGLGSIVDIRIGKALDTLPKLAAEGIGPFDLVFIDADKESYPDYLAWAADNLRKGGIVLLDNAFLFGGLADAPTGDRAAQIRAMQSVHETLARSGKFRATVLPTGEGLALGIRL
jgi:predicted O-methyltransferase YrrM